MKNCATEIVDPLIIYKICLYTFFPKNYNFWDFSIFKVTGVTNEGIVKKRLHTKKKTMLSHRVEFFPFTVFARFAFQRVLPVDRSQKNVQKKQI